MPQLNRRGFITSLAAFGGFLALPRLAFAGQHYAFVKFEANGSVIDSGHDFSRFSDDLSRGEWIQCKRVTYGLKRDIGTGGRVSGHTHYDRLEFKRSGGPSYDELVKALSAEEAAYDHLALDCADTNTLARMREALEGKQELGLTLQLYRVHEGKPQRYMVTRCGAGLITTAETAANNSDADPHTILHYAFHDMQIDHVGEDGATAASFDWSGASQAG